MRIRRLEDLDSAALTYAEVKAIASGNPLVIEKAQVDAGLMRSPRGCAAAHAEEQYRIRSNLRRSHEAEMFTGRLTNLRQDMMIRQGHIWRQVHHVELEASKPTTEGHRRRVDSPACREVKGPFRRRRSHRTLRGL